ncbi:MAG: hypothetical protein KAU24_04275 [Candidatus Aenigmarchaeota archaeon]|nr:hypothetical protein [Candidatus Aenigmarchaeota archaeon]
MKKERIALWVFWVLFLTLTFTWLGVGKFVNRCLHQPPKPALTEQQKAQYFEEAEKIFSAVKEKGKNLTPKDFFLYQHSLYNIERGVGKYWNAPPTLLRLTMNLAPYYKSLERKIIKQGQSPGFVMSQAQIEAWKEVGFKGAAPNVFTTENVKKVLLWLLKFGFIVFILVPLIYYYRCQERGESFKELILVQPWSFFAYMVFWPVGLGFDYPDGTVGVVWKYHKLREKYISEREWKYKLTKEEEQMLWQHAKGRIEKFDLGVAKAFAYSRTMAYVSTLIIWVLSPLHQKGLLMAGEVKEEKAATKVVKEEKLDFSGFLQFKYENSQGKDTFSVPMVVVSLKGDLTENISWKLEADVVNKKMRDLWLYFAFDDWLKIKTGKWFACFTAASPPDKWYLIEYPKPVSLATIYGVGVVADGDVGPIKYYIGILNGNGAESSDNNRDKDVYFNLAFKPLEKFSIGTAYQEGRQPEGMREKFGSHIKVDIPELNLKFLSEYMYEKMDGVVKRGWYALGIWKPWESFEFVCQYDRFREPQNKQKSLTLGINHFVGDLKLQLNYVFSNLGNKLLAKAQVSF